MSSTPPLWKLRVRHILESVERCRTYVHGLTQEQFGADTRTLYAVAWCLTVIGEAARHVPDEVSARYPEIPWAQMGGMRNHIVHGYDQIDLEVVWKVLCDHLPALVPHLERMLSEAGE
jgi:uncharacterized protein with HEPN domain